MKLFQIVVDQFGFQNMRDFIGSLIHVKLLPLTITIASLSAFFSTYLGLKGITVLSFILLLTLELATGLVVSIHVNKKRINSRKFSRFGFKIFVWMLLFFIIHSFKMQWKDENRLVFSLFGWLYDLIIIYVCLEYLISVLENLGAISGKSNATLIKALRNKLNKLLDLDSTNNSKNE